MNDYLPPNERYAAALAQSYAVWEQHTRGWSVWDYAVQLEPPFFPIKAELPAASPVPDDAQVPRGFMRLFNRNNFRARQIQSIAEQNLIGQADENSMPPAAFYRAEDITELHILPSNEAEISPLATERFLLSAGSGNAPVSCEIRADSQEISVQMACDKSYAPHLKNSLKTFFPNEYVGESRSDLSSYFENPAAVAIADFGLARNFLLPLQNFRAFNPDPLAGLLGSLNILRADEKALFQILFQNARSVWAETVHGFSGNPTGKTWLPASFKDKLSSPLVAAVIRLAVQGATKQQAWETLRCIGGNLIQFSNPNGNELIAVSGGELSANNHLLSLLNRTSYRSGMLLSVAELAGLAHLPAPSVVVEKLKRNKQKTKIAPAISIGHALILGENIHQGSTRQVSLSPAQRSRHMFICGGSGGGKSTLLLNLALQDIERGDGCCVVDSAGDLISDIIARIPDHRLADVIVLDPADEFPVGFNPLQADSETEKYLLSGDMVALLRRYSTAWGGVMEAATAQAVNALLFNSLEHATLLDLKRFLAEKDFRRRILQTTEDDAARHFWEYESSAVNAKSIASVLIRLDGFLRHKLIRNIVSQRENGLNFRRIIDERKILLVKLSQGLGLGEENTAMLGTLLVGKIYQTALGRQDTSSENRTPFWCYCDEAQNYLSPSLGSILAGARKYGIGLTLGTQSFRYLQNQNADVAASILANCYTRICFRVGDDDARRFAAGFDFFTESDLQNLGIGEAIARIERAAQDFNLKTYPAKPISRVSAQWQIAAVMKNSRQFYGKPKKDIELQAKTEWQKESGNPVAAEPVLSVQPISDKDSATLRNRQKDDSPVLSDAAQDSTNFNKGRGGKHHQELQAVIKRVAENYGFFAAIEKSVLDGAGSVDVSLEKENLKIACEVSITSTAEYETKNALKCLAAGYDYAVIVVANQKKLSSIQTNIDLIVPLDEQKKVKVLSITGLLGFLRQLIAPQPAAYPKARKPAGQRLNFAEACEFFNVGASTLYRWIRQGKIPFYRPGREYQFDRDELLLLGRHELSGKQKTAVKLEPLQIKKSSPKSKKKQDVRYRKLLNLD